MIFFTFSPDSGCIVASEIVEVMLDKLWTLRQWWRCLLKKVIVIFVSQCLQCIIFIIISSLKTLRTLVNVLNDLRSLTWLWTLESKYSCSSSYQLVKNIFQKNISFKTIFFSCLCSQEWWTSWTWTWGIWSVSWRIFSCWGSLCHRSLDHRDSSHQDRFD